jgi:hypothetical protein
LLFVLCTVVLVLVSLTAPPPPPEQITGLTYQTTVRTGQPRERMTLEVVLSVVVVVLIGVLWVYFSR